MPSTMGDEIPLVPVWLDDGVDFSKDPLDWRAFDVTDSADETVGTVLWLETQIKSVVHENQTAVETPRGAEEEVLDVVYNVI
ncbi:hypothetical protein B1759_18435 [Rubrivirga sp. SAORIC476]|nr:hypothetical protein B1759_18435 [Rubrivirga sp. SAORIC476]